ncbi:hypothetical protein [Streptomyces massasporeus]|uniref:hypothetical protein n=1 Tax=Streptomyces massasporeus TaxID=67324 RepID=UPI00167A2573|nr:hypothetical protein [Streptomyces massasporeus]GGV92000.1 hypothetical protein GCM10010228_83390 [Streptomyces massasporeus]
MALNLLPKGTGRRRAIDKVAELRRDLSLALSQMHAAGDEIALLQQDLAEARGMQAEAEEIVVQQQATVDELTTERDYWRDEALALKARFSAQLAVDANTHRIDVPPMIRPIDGPEDQATGPIDVRPLWDAVGIRPVTDPGRTH